MFLYAKMIKLGISVEQRANRLEFVLENGYFKHTKSGKCVRPKGSVTDGVKIGLYSSCEGHQFSFTAGGSLQHVASRKCVNPRTGVSTEFWKSNN